MHDNRTKSILESLQQGQISVDDALLQLKLEPFQDLGYAKSAMEEAGQETVLITRLSPEAAEIVGRTHPLTYHEMGRIATVGPLPEPDGLGTIVIATGGTSDVPVAEEAAVTAQALGNRVRRLYDVGVAGVHRLLANLEYIMDASVIIAIAGMEGALASVVGGLADCPVIAVPTSVGYGASFQFLRQRDFCGEH